VFTAVTHRQPALVRALLQSPAVRAGAFFHPAPTGGPVQPWLPLFTGPHGRTAMHAACAAGALDTVLLLLGYQRDMALRPHALGAGPSALCSQPADDGSFPLWVSGEFAPPTRRGCVQDAGLVV
jgi:hypothetical protein